LKNAGNPESTVKSAPDPFPELTGQYYLLCLKECHDLLRPRTYLEIGTRHGDSLKLARCAAIAVDPSFELDCQLPTESMPALCLFQMTSDRFFELYAPRSILGGPIDLAFLDGMHVLEGVLEDFIYTERACHKQSVVLVHDCVPLDYHMTRRDQHDPKRRNLSVHPDWWTGDVWKLLPVLKEYRPDLKIEVFNAPPTGLVVIRQLDPNSGVLAEHRDEIVEKFRYPTDEFALFAEYQSSLEVIDTAGLRGPGSLFGGKDAFPHSWSVNSTTNDRAFCKPATSSSVSRWSRYQDPERDACGANGEHLADDYGFHTQLEADPWWMVDLLEEQVVEEVAIVNRLNASERFRTFRIETSSDGKIWTTRFTQASPCEVSSNPERPWRVRFTDPLPARYVRIVLLGVGVLHLRRVQVYGAPVSAPQE
jgi:hypothetical protein